MQNKSNSETLVTIIVPTYNRSHTIKRCLNSILAQSHEKIQVVIVDDGSTDNTLEVLSQYSDKRIEVLKHEINKGVCSAKNTGLDAISGEWFTILDSDDEAIPFAIEALLNVLNYVDSDVSAITCNCIDTSTGEFSGKGLIESQYITVEDIMQKCSGEHWGLTKTKILGSDRLNENIRGSESVLWHKISLKAKRYYLHRALRIYHTEGEDRISRKVAPDLKREMNEHYQLSKEEKYINDLRKYAHKRYCRHMAYIGIYSCSTQNRMRAFKILSTLLKESSIREAIMLFTAVVCGVEYAQRCVNMIYALRRGKGVGNN